MSAKNRLSRLERARKQDDGITVIHVNWREDGLIEDPESEELLTEEEYKARYPDSIFIGFDEGENDEKDEA